ncbi:MAG: TIGR03768 family metallophosphoesterase [Firmicutes bacterium]|nr:TIGR03768 family metallophosphoesterase [Bacillota bacterium]
MNRIFGLGKICLIFLIGLLTFAYAGCSNSNDNSQENQAVTSYPIDPDDAKTTAERTIVLSTEFSEVIPPENLKDTQLYDKYGYGVWSYGPGLAPEVRTDIMPEGYNTSGVTQKTKLLNFFTISDIHITDKEAPNQLIYLQQINPTIGTGTSVYSPIMPYTTHVLDAAIQTVNALHKKNKFDFGLSLGDAANSTQYNELRWYMDVIDGKVITPSSGAHAGADSVDFQKPYKAAGLDKSIPFYQALGNHDHFFIGSIPVDAAGLRNTYISDTIFAAGNVLINPLSLSDPIYYMGTLDCSTENAEIVKAGPVGDFSSPPKVVADSNRRSLLKTEWINEFFDTTSYPVGHGFSKSNVKNDFACYSFVPNPDVPLKVIVLDDTQIENDGSKDIHGHGYLTEERWVWLKNELAAGDAAGQLMIIAAHIPIGVENEQSETGWWINPNPNTPPNACTLKELVTELQKHPNLLMWIAGHRHVNTVKAFISTDSTRPENGFWQVETPSLRDFPRNLRTFEIFANNDNTISIVALDVDPAVAKGSPAEKSRKYAVATEQIYKNNMAPNNPGADPNLPADIEDPTIKPMNPQTYIYNAELLKQLSPDMQKKIAALRKAGKI